MKTKHNWEKIVADWSASGLSVKDYCKEFKITKSVFYHHKKRVDESSCAKISSARYLAKKLPKAQSTNQQKLSNEPVKFAEVVPTAVTIFATTPAIKITTKTAAVWEFFL